MGIFFIGRGLSLPSQLWMRRQLKALEQDVTVLAATPCDIKSYKRRFKIVAIREHHARILWRVAHSITSANIARAIKSRKVSKVLVHFATDAVRYQSALSTSTKPVFVYCHGYDVTWDLRNQFATDFRQRMHSHDYVDKVRNLPDNFSFIANSKSTQKRLLEIGIPVNRIHLNYLGVEIPSTLPKHSRQTSDLTVLFLGRLIDCKGPDLVIRAFERACEIGFSGNLVMAGDGPLSLTCELLRSHSPHRDRIKLLGPVDGETGERLRKEADIFTAHNCTGPVSGQEEAFGVSMVEAMAAGLPIVNTINGSVPEVVENEKQGILVNAGDIEAHANALIRLGSNPDLRQEYGNNGWNRARNNFSIELEANRLREILNGTKK